MKENSIGKALKDVRQYWGMTQEQWASGVISTSYYSKVESGKAEITAKDLFQIVKANNMSILMISGMTSVHGKGSPIEKIKDQILIAQTTGKTEEIDKVIQNIEQSYNLSQENHKLINLFIEGATVWITGNNKNVSEDDKKSAKDLILKSNWDRSSFLSLAILISLFDINEGYMLIMSAINYYSEVNKVPGEMKLVLAIINYLNYSWRNGVNKKYIEIPIKFVRKMSRGPIGMGYKVLCTYYEALFEHDYEKAEVVAECLRYSNCSWMISNTSEES